MIAEEWATQWTRRRTLILVVATALFPVVMTIAIVASGSSQVDRVGDIPLVIVPHRSGLAVPLIALSSTMRFFLPLAVAVVAGECIAGEAATGRLRYALAGPISRTRYLAVKALVAASISAALVAVLLIAATVSGLLAFGWHPLTAVNGDQTSAASVATFSQWDSLGKLAIGTAYIAAGMASIFAFALLLSTLTTRPFVAVAGGAAFSVVSRVFNADYLPGVNLIGRYMPNNDIDLWQHLFSSPPGSAGMGRFLILQVGYVAVFATVGWRLFNRRDVLV